MPTLFIDRHEVRVDDGATLLDAAHTLGMAIPTLCHVPGLPASGSCMVCAVRIEGVRELRPACATRAQEGMRVVSDSDELRTARRMALDLLLGDHLGDCEGPCERVCPAGLDIPRILRQIGAGEIDAARHALETRSPLPATIERLCPAPCERICRRGLLDADAAGVTPAAVLPVSIRELMRDLAASATGAATPDTGAVRPPAASSDRTVAIIGAGPCGLGAAFELNRRGFRCTVFDRHGQAGGSLRAHVQSGALPAAELDADLGRLHAGGIEFRLNQAFDAPAALDALRAEFEAVLLATGGNGVPAMAALRDPHTKYATNRPGVWIAGAAAGRVRDAVRTLADGQSAARIIARALPCGPQDGAGPDPHPFNSHIGHPQSGESAAFLAQAGNPGPRRSPPATPDGWPAAAARHEAARCLHCDCRKRDGCRLREQARALDAQTGVFRAPERRTFVAPQTAPDAIFESGKCIACGACEQITAQAGIIPGLTFSGRGIRIRIERPFDAPLSDALRHTARPCIRACPTGALSAPDPAGEAKALPGL